MALFGATFAIGVPFLIIGLVALVLFVVVLVDMVRRPTWQWKQAGSNKAIWLTLEIALFVLFGFLSIISSIIYLVAARPKLIAAERAGGPGAYPPGWGDQGYGQYGQGQYGQGQYPYGQTGQYPYGQAPGYGAPSAPPGAYGTPGPAEGGSAPPAYPGSAPYGQPQAPAQTQPQTEQNGGGEVPASWQPDPSHRHELRYWDGTRWTEHVSDAGRQSTDPPVA